MQVRAVAEDERARVRSMQVYSVFICKNAVALTKITR